MPTFRLHPQRRETEWQNLAFARTIKNLPVAQLAASTERNSSRSYASQRKSYLGEMFPGKHSLLLALQHQLLFGIRNDRASLRAECLRAFTRGHFLPLRQSRRAQRRGGGRHQKFSAINAFGLVFVSILIFRHVHSLVESQLCFVPSIRSPRNRTLRRRWSK